MDSSLEPRRAPEGHPPHGHPAPFEPSRPAAVPLVKVERVYCPEKAEEGPRKREATPLDKYPPPPPREPGARSRRPSPRGPGPSWRSSSRPPRLSWASPGPHSPRRPPLGSPPDL